MMKALRVESPKFNRSGTISALVEWDSLPGELHPFSASSEDVEAHGRQLFEDLKAGAFGDIAPYTAEDAHRDLITDKIHEQQALIAEADDVIRPLSDERDAGIISDDDSRRWKAWIVYRKALREVDVSRDEVAWPAKPE